jgi:hypothetical protein
VLDRPDADALQRLALAILPTLRHPNGVYCFDRQPGGPLRGTSPRYTLMVRLGLQRAAAAGLSDGTLDAETVALVRAGTHRLSVGDLGLLLWGDVRDDHEGAEETLDRLVVEISSNGTAERLEGMEIGWIGMGLAEAVAGGLAGAEPQLRRVLDHLLDHRRARSGLYRHRLDSPFRQELPNFATEIYSLLLLARVARLDLDDRANDAATALGEILVGHRRADGSWPWLYDATNGRVVEPYELYSVHQDAMAPMAFFELADATGDLSWVDAALAGFGYGFGENELGESFYDETGLFAHRSIRRRQPWARIATNGNAVCERVTGRRIPLPLRLELNRTCRPYHLGWILEAWSGRPDVVERQASTRR